MGVVVWGKSAEACGENLSKGSPILVDGRLQSRSWETEDGQKRSTMEVVAERVQFLGPRKGLAAPGGAADGEPMEAPGAGEAPPAGADDIPF